MIIIDSNVWIFSENENSDEHELAAKRIKDVLDSGNFGVNVVITSEVYHILSKFLGTADASGRMTNIIEHPRAQWMEFTDEVVINAIKLSNAVQLRINDALIASQALQTGASVLTDNVKDFQKVKGLKIIPLR